MQTQDIHEPQRVGWRCFAALMPGFLLSNLEGTLVNVALPDIQQDLAAPLSLLAWVPMACQLPMATLSVLMGLLADRLGRKRIYLAGLCLLGLGSILGWLAPDLAWLLAARALQGMGAAALVANGLALVAEQFEPSQRGHALGIMTATVGLGAIIAPPLGGVLAETWGWRSIFLANLPVVLLGLYHTGRRIPGDAGRNPGGLPSLLVLRNLLMAAAVGCGVLGLSSGGRWRSAGSSLVWPALLGALVLGGAFLKLERHSHQPLLPWSGLGRRRVGSLIALTAVAALVAAVSFALPLFLHAREGLEGLALGLRILPLPLGLVAGAAVGGRLGDRLGRRGPTLVGIGLMAVGLGLHEALLFLGLLLTGAGVGAFSVSNNAELVHGSSSSLGTLTGLMGMLRQLGALLGVALAAGRVALQGAEAGLFAALWILVPALLGVLWAYSRGPGPEASVDQNG